MQKRNKHTLEIRIAKKNMDECKFNVSVHYLCYEEAFETLTCGICGSKVIKALTKAVISLF